MVTPPLMVVCKLNPSAIITLGSAPMNMSPAPTYHKLKTRSCISDGKVSCSTVVKIGTMLLVSTTNKMHWGTQNQGDKAKSRINPKIKFWADGNQSLYAKCPMKPKQQIRIKIQHQPRQ